jgi:quinol monooxygenase YgiN
VIIVTGSVHARADTLDEVLRLALEHVRRSRGEHGCLLHSVHQDVEDSFHVVFLEHWADRHALLAHFEVPESRRFARTMRDLAVVDPVIEIHEAEVVHF